MCHKFFPHSQQLEISRKIVFGGVLLKQLTGENARKLLKMGPKCGPDFFAHAHVCVRACGLCKKYMYYIHIYYMLKIKLLGTSTFGSNTKPY